MQRTILERQKRFGATFVAALGLMALILAATTSTVHAQSTTTGAVRGQIFDKSSGEPVIGATVVATSASLQGSQTAITSSDGFYNLTGLPPGTYLLAVYYAEAQFSRSNVLVRIGKTSKVNIRVNTAATAGEVIEIEGSAPIIDQVSTKNGVTINSDFTENIPTGRTFGAVLGAAAGSQDDTYGVSFGGSTSVENTYIVEGLNTTDPGFGLLTTNLPNEFIYETEVITGGYGAEYGRSTGAVVNVVTKSGSNELRGSVFSYWTPGALVADREAIAQAGASIDRADDLANAFDIGFELGGPIVKDKLWFHVGFNPSFRYTDVNRTIKTLVDKDGDGAADVDSNGFQILEEIAEPTARSSQLSKRKQYYYTAKINGAINPNHQGQVSFLGSFTDRNAIGTVTGERSAGAVDISEKIIDFAGKWSSKFNDNKTQIDFVAGLHTDITDQSPRGSRAGESQVRYETPRPLTDFAAFETRGVPEACDDMAADDPYPMITNCPVPLYRTGGVGFLEDQKATRLVGILSATQRVEAAGHHTFKAGLEIEQQGYDSDREYSGKGWYRQRGTTVWTVRTFQTIDANGDLPCGPDVNGDGTPDANCRTVDGQLSASTNTRNLGAYIQDSWSILPNLTANIGLRWEKQTLFTADEIAGQVSNVSGLPIPDKAFELSNMVAPRLGVIYDPTGEGKSRVYGHFGRFYESIPQDINVRAYGGEIIAIDVYAPDGCDLENPVGSCAEESQLAALSFGDSDVVNDPDLKAQYLDEIVLGGEYEVLPDFKVGATYVHRALGRIIEDVSTDGGGTYAIVNPSEVHQGAIDDLRKQADEIRDMDPGRADQLDFQADTLAANAQFDTPSRSYDALEVKATKRFSNNVFALASYTYSRLRGNYPGLFSPETGQLDPNLTSMYDLPELMANRYGALKADRPHLFKLDGYYSLPVAQQQGVITFGLSTRITSGSAHTPLGSNFAYGRQESYLLPRGAAGRSPLATRFDVKLLYGHKITKTNRLEAFVDVFNVFNQQTQLSMDEEYTRDDVNPIVGGTTADLAHAKAIGDGGDTSKTLISKQPNYGNTNSRQAPLSMRFGMRLTF